ncbi:hypothetical protein [Achromobacter xylosoxidans]|uniref:hypothetical protein n=1 Tax=Alcaligenes xylosoxydans xylosoxydans TaxID=85698 RepID=UPI001F22F438|nr:hypothetical protein [Achromobacter xylosoxidans]
MGLAGHPLQFEPQQQRQPMVGGAARVARQARRQRGTSTAVKPSWRRPASSGSRAAASAGRPARA